MKIAQKYSVFGGFGPSHLQNFKWIDFILLFTIDDRKVSSQVLQPGRPKLHIVKIPTRSQ